MLLAAELKSLVSWGASNHCLNCRTLKELIQRRHPGVEGSTLSGLICKQLEIAAWKLDPREAKACLVLLRLGYGWRSNADSNRAKAMEYLGELLVTDRCESGYMSPQTFSKGGTELALMQKLAGALELPVGQKVWVVEHTEVVSQSPLELRVRLREA